MKLKRHLLLGRIAMTNLDRILKNRDITLSSKVHIVKAMVFPIVTYGCESWTIKKAECQRTDAFEMWCWRRLLRVPWTARRSNQSILKEIGPEYSLEALMLKLQYFGHLMWRADSMEKTRRWERLKTRGEGATEDKTVGWHHQFNGHEFEQTLGDGGAQGSLECWSPRGRRVGHNWVTKQWQEMHVCKPKAEVEMRGFASRRSRKDERSLKWLRMDRNQFEKIGRGTEMTWRIKFSCSVGSNSLQHHSPWWDYSLPGSSVHGIFQATTLEWVVISSSRGSSWPRNRIHVSYIGRWIFFFFFYHWVTCEALTWSM